MPDSRTGAEKVPDEPETSCGARKQRNAQRMRGTCQKDAGATWNGLPLGKSATIWAPNYVTLVTDYNPLSRIRNLESILTQINKLNRLVTWCQSTSHKILIRYRRQKNNIAVEKSGRHQPHQVIKVNVIRNWTHWILSIGRMPWEDSVGEEHRIPATDAGPESSHEKRQTTPNWGTSSNSLVLLKIKEVWGETWQLNASMFLFWLSCYKEYHGKT